MTIKDIANEAGVSTQTVSRYFNNPEKLSESIKLKIEPVIKKYDYVPNKNASNLRSGNVNTILIIVNSFTNPYYSSLISGILANSSMNKYNYVLIQDKEFRSHDAVMKHFSINKYVGIILLSGQLKLESVQYLCDTFPMISNANYECQNANVMCIDEHSAAITLINALINDGYSKIGFLVSEYNHAQTNTWLQRMKAINEKSQVSPVYYNPSNEFKFKQAYQNFDALICYHDLQMFYFDIEIQKRGIDVITTSFDGTYLCAPKKVYIHKDNYYHGQLLSESLINIINGQNIGTYTLDYNLIQN